VNSISQINRFGLLILLSVLTFSSTNGQVNLIPNPSFEIYNLLPDHDGAFTGYLWSWSSANPDKYNFPAATPDYIHKQGKGRAFCNANGTYFGYQVPHTGLGFVNLVTNNGNSDEFCEYIVSELQETLTEDKTYQFSFWISNAQSNNYCGNVSNGLGVGFTYRIPVQSMAENIKDVTPIYVMKEATYFADWTKIEFEFKAKGTEKYITMGNFLKYKEMEFKQVPTSGKYKMTCFFIDDLSLVIKDPKKDSLIPPKDLVSNKIDSSLKGGLKVEKPILAKELSTKDFDPKRTVNVIQEYYVQTDTFSLDIWDNEIEDGDIVTLEMNGKVILSKYKLLAKKKKVKIQLEPTKDNVLQLFAHNLGEISPNTAAILPNVGNGKTFILESTLKKSQAVRFVIER